MLYFQDGLDDPTGWKFSKKKLKSLDMFLLMRVTPPRMRHSVNPELNLQGFKSRILDLL